MKKPKKPQTAENADAEGNSPLPARKRTYAKDAAVIRALETSGGRVPKAAQILGCTSSAVRKRTGPKAKKELRGLPEKIKSAVRTLVQVNVLELLKQGDPKMTIEVMHSKLCADMGLAPVQKVELSGKVDGDLRLGPLDEQLVAERLKALGVEDEP